VANREHLQRPTKMDARAAVPDFLATLVIIVAAKAAQRLIRGTWYGSTPHLRVLRVVVVMCAEISGLLLEAGGRLRGACRSA
jgi:hypothetical protein